MINCQDWLVVGIIADEPFRIRSTQYTKTCIVAGQMLPACQKHIEPRLILRELMANEFDPYREALVVEETTVWPDDYDGWDDADKAKVAPLLHAEPAECADMRYERQHTGFARVVTVTQEDLDRVGVQVQGSGA